MSAQITNWFEVYSPDVASAKKFYNAVFGYTTESMPMGEGGEYFMLHNGKTIFGGIMDLGHPAMAGVPPHWGTYFHTPNTTATIEKAQSMGATVVYGPMDIPDIGIVAGITDNCGAHFNVHQPAGEQTDISEGAVNWVEHMGPDREKAVAFYTNLFGWGTMDMPMGEPVGTYTMFTVNDEPRAGCMQAAEVHPNWAVYLHSDNLEATCEKVTANGGKVINPPMDIGQNGRIAIAADCCGAVFGIHEPPKM